jgi:DNA polymerase-1
MSLVLLIDAYALLHRAFHSLPSMNNRRGEPTNAIYGTARILLKLLENFKPTHVVAAVDRKERTFRHLLYSEYKANRRPTDEMLVPQIARLADLLHGLGIKTIGAAGYEADDVIGTMATRACQGGFGRVAVVTGDRDLLQLVNEQIQVYLPGKSFFDLVCYDGAMVVQRFDGVGPSQLPDFKALCGDASDNIPGIPGIGKKMAARLLAAYGSVEGMIDRLDTLDPKVKVKLAPRLDELRTYLKLTTVVRDIPVELSIDDCCWKGVNPGRIIPLFEELEFKSIMAWVQKMQSIFAYDPLRSKPTGANVTAESRAAQSDELPLLSLLDD